MSPEGLNQRFNRCAVLFLQRVFSLLIKSKLNDSSQIPNQYTSYFQRIRILDATIFQVSNHLAPIHPGSGGCAQTAGIKIQLEYDLHSGKFLNFQMEPGKNNDKTFGTECLDTLRPGDLCIRDLGYFSLKDLDQMDQRGVFYISRLKLNNRVYVKNESPEFFRIHLSKDETSDNQIKRVISKDKDHPITAQLDIPVIQVKGNTSAPFQDKNDLSVNLISESGFHKMNKILKLGDIPNLSGEHAIAFQQYINQPATDFIDHKVNIQLPAGNYTFKLNKLEKKAIRLTSGSELLYIVIDNARFDSVAKQISPITYKAYKVADEKTTKETSEIVMTLVGNDTHMRTFYKEYKKIKALTGMKIFVVSSLALVLLVATGSIIYFKQLTEAHSDKNRYEILRKIGVNKKEVRTTISKQTLFIFLLPLIIGILNAAMLTMSVSLQYSMDIQQDIISFIYAMTTYGVIYLVYYVLTINSYNRIVNK